MDLQILKPPITKGTTNVFDGTVGGAATVVGGTLVSATVFVGVPITTSWIAYDHLGPLYVIFAIPVGISLGSVAGATVLIGSVYSGLAQTVFGLFRTPKYLYALGSSVIGRDLDWDTSLEDWVYYNLVEDAKINLKYNDEQIKDALNGDIVAASWVSMHSDFSQRPDHTVIDTEYYEVLGIQPNATLFEIKQAYYLKARVHHPDRNLGDPNAIHNFQKVGAAYLVLSDPALRKEYDHNGKDAANRNPMDAGALFAMVFGSEDFELLVGELWIAPIMKMFSEGKYSHYENYSLKQRVREVKCALALVSKLLLFTQGRHTEFEKCKEQSIELAKTPLGAAFLRLIGNVYIDRAKSESNTLEALFIRFEKSGVNVYDTCALAHTVVTSYSAFTELTHLEQKAEDVISDEVADKLRDNIQVKKRDSIEKVVRLLWIVTKLDIAQTVDRICIKALHDHSVSSSELMKRREALLQLGQAYVTRGGNEEQGLHDVLTRLLAQTGM